MKPISEWTDAEIDTVKLFGKDGIEHFAAEVLRLRGNAAYADETLLLLNRDRNEWMARAEKAEAELARCRPVVDAALAWFDANSDGFYGGGRRAGELRETIDAYRDGDNQ